MTGESDRLLVQQIRGGGAKADAAWNELVSRYEGRLRGLVANDAPRRLAR